EAAAGDAEVRERWRRLWGRFVDRAASHFAAERRRGRISDRLDTESAAEALVWMVERCCELYLARGERGPEELVQPLASVWVAALYPGVTPAEELRPDGPGDPLWGVPQPEFRVTDTRSRTDG